MTLFQSSTARFKHIPERNDSGIGNKYVNSSIRFDRCTDHCLAVLDLGEIPKKASTVAPITLELVTKSEKRTDPEYLRLEAMRFLGENRDRSRRSICFTRLPGGFADLPIFSAGSIEIELLEHLSPLGWEHINLTGD